MKEKSNYIKSPLCRGFFEITELWKLVQEYNSVICGGYARYCASQKPNPYHADDVDIFPQDNNSSNNLILALMNRGFEIKHENEISVTFKKNTTHINPFWKICPTIQVIRPVLEGAIVTVGTTEDILDNFDFSVVRCAIISPTEALIDQDFIEDDSHNRLVLKNIHCPISSLMRCIKYSAKGYYLSMSETIKLFKDWDERSTEYKEQLIDAIDKLHRDNIEKLKEDEREKLYKLMRVD